MLKASLHICKVWIHMCGLSLKFLYVVSFESLYLIPRKEKEKKSGVPYLCLQCQKAKSNVTWEGQAKKGRKVHFKKTCFHEFFSLEIFQNRWTTRLVWGHENVDKNTQKIFDVDFFYNFQWFSMISEISEVTHDTACSPRWISRKDDYNSI